MPNSPLKSLELHHDILTVVQRYAFNRYVDLVLRLQGNVVGEQPTWALNPTPNKFASPAKKVAEECFVSDNSSSRRCRNDREVQMSQDRRDGAQPSMPIQASQVMNILQDRFQTSIRVADRLFRSIRLYRL